MGKPKENTRFDFNDWIAQNPTKRDYDNILGDYDYNILQTQKIFDRINRVNPNDTDELEAIVNLIRLWKINRLGDSSGSLHSLATWVRTIDFKIDAKKTELKERIKFVDQDSNDYEKQIQTLLEDMLKGDGVGLPMASAILHFFNPKVFPVIDHRDYRSIYAIKHNERRELSNSKQDFMAKLYLEFVRECKDYCLNDKSGKVTMEDVDKYFYVIDQKIGNPVNFKDDKDNPTYTKTSKIGYYLIEPIKKPL